MESRTDSFSLSCLLQELWQTCVFVVVLLVLRISVRCIFFRELVNLCIRTGKHVICLMLNFNICSIFPLEVV